MDRVHYRIELSDISAHQLSIQLTFMPSSASHELSLPAWIPGSYMIRNFARHIMQISARDADGDMDLTQLDKQRWQLSCRNQAITVSYLIYANDMSVRAAYLDDEVAILNPACLCLAVSGQTSLPQQLELTRPGFRVTENWRVATALPRSSGTAMLDFGMYQAANYSQLIDSPLLLGHFTLQQFAVDGVPHYLVVSGQNHYNSARLLADTEQICLAQRAVFGGLPDDLSHYWFLLWITENGYGGLEHQDSTLLLCSRHDLPAPQLKAPDEAYQTLLGLISHEYFHTWWVKRLKPAPFHAYQLAQEQYTPQLWLYEGFTSYFDDLALVKSGLISQSAYLTALEQLVTRVTRNPSDSRQSLADSSFNAWTKYYLQDENAPNSIVSYYAKGALVALAVEAELQAAGTNLGAFCRDFYQQYLATGTADKSFCQALAAQGFTALANQVTEWVNRAQPLPLAESFAKLGLTLSWRSPQHFDDTHGNNEQAVPASLGCSLKPQNGVLTVQQLYLDSAAHQAGLMAGDQLLALAGYKVTEKSLPQLLKRLPYGSVQPLTIFRKDRLLTLSLTLQAAKAQVAMLSVADQSKVSSWLAQAT